jgi:hypothetical protein
MWLILSPPTPTTTLRSPPRSPMPVGGAR